MADGDTKIWSDHSNPMVAAAERRLFLVGSEALVRLGRDLGGLLGVDMRTPPRPAVPERRNDATR